jgi:hypothetical protein
MQIEVLRTVNKALVEDRPGSAEDCVKWARDLFDTLYHNDIAQLLHNFPPNQVQICTLTEKNQINKSPLSIYYRQRLKVNYFGLAQNVARIH